jgi:hypothetical protein
MKNLQKEKNAILKNLSSIVLNKKFNEILNKNEIEQIYKLAKKLTLEL